MEIRQLRYLIAIVEARNFTRAAETLYVSQSALSQQIQSLEKEVGAVLLDRSRQGVRLTAAGEILYHHALRVLNELESARTAMNELEGLQRGKLSVGVVQTVNAYLMPQLAAHFASAYPGLHLTVEELAAGQIEEGLECGRLQLGVSFAPTNVSELDFEMLFEEELVMIVPCDHPLRGRSSVMVKELERTPMVMFSQAFCTRRLWDRCAQEAGICPHINLEMNTMSGILAAVQSSGLATVLPLLALPRDPSAGLTAVRLVNPTPRRQVGLVFLRGGYRCAATRAFARLVAEAVSTPDSERSQVGYS